MQEGIWGGGHRLKEPRYLCEPSTEQSKGVSEAMTVLEQRARQGYLYPNSKVSVRLELMDERDQSEKEPQGDMGGPPTLPK